MNTFHIRLKKFALGESMVKFAISFIFILMPLHVLAFNSIINPQIQYGQGFEGWYTKVDTPQRSVVIIVGTKLHKSRLLTNVGMVSVLIKEGHRPTEHFEYFPKNPILGKKTDPFLWKTQDEHVVFSQNEILVNHHALPKLNVQLNKHDQWSKKSPFGPEGLMVKNPFLYSHWYVFSMNSQASLVMKHNGQHYHEQGHAHIEKNWGKSFPDAWFWAQGRDVKNKVSLSFAGGRAPLRVHMPINVWALSLKVAEKEFVFAPKFSHLNAKIKTDCQSYFDFYSRHNHFTVSLNFESPKDKFISIYGISKDHWEEVAKESLHSKVRITLKEHQKIIFQKKISNTVIEFGGTCRENFLNI